MAKIIGEFFDLIGGGAHPSFHSEPWYNEAGDSIHYHWEPDEFYGDRIDDKLTLYRSVTNDAIVGCQIKGIGALLKKFGDFGISVSDGGATLATFFCVSHLTAESGRYDPQKRRQAYLYLVENHGKARFDVPAIVSASEEE
ncbi:MAG TPA: hypothetical protein VFE47_13335 [Tepidisphaeraceae bacterium]|jgi:hypothetical protein|nr:hypothetical protein [Tepidisphaeraceae bacterium]